MTSRRYEPSDLPPRGIAAAIGGLFVGLLASIALVAGLVAWMTLGRPAPDAARDGEPPLPRLESAPRADRVRLEAAARRRLESYGWSDRGHGLARVPISRAMALVAARGWGEDSPAPTTEEIARRHAGAGR